MIKEDCAHHSVSLDQINQIYNLKISLQFLSTFIKVKLCASSPVLDLLQAFLAPADVAVDIGA